MNEVLVVESNSLSEFKEVEGLTGETIVIMPSIDIAKARQAAKILIERAGLGNFHLVIALDERRIGFIAAINKICMLTNFKYLIYLAEDVFPGRFWFKFAHDLMEKSEKGLLAFNDGKWFGQYAAFGMVRISWVRKIYGNKVFFPEYHSNFADIELSKIASEEGQLIYSPNILLIEVDFGKGQAWESNKRDQALYQDRQRQGFPRGFEPKQSVKAKVLKDLESASYKQILDLDLENFKRKYAKHEKIGVGVSIIIPNLNGLPLLKNLIKSLGDDIHSLEDVEFIIIDHASSDGSRDYIRNLSATYGADIFRIIERERNYSFSESCNFGASMSKYDSIIFCNNDVEAGAQVISIFSEFLHKSELSPLLGVQIFEHAPNSTDMVLAHNGIGFKWSEQRNYFQPFNISQAQPVGNFLSHNHSVTSNEVTVRECLAVTAAFMGIRRQLFEAVGGFCEEYFYGCEDVDLNMKVLAHTHRFPQIVTGMGVLHNEMTTRGRVLTGPQRQLIFGTNHEIFKVRWSNITAVLSECQ